MHAYPERGICRIRIIAAQILKLCRKTAQKRYGVGMRNDREKKPSRIPIPSKKRLLEEVTDRMRLRNYIEDTVEHYVRWIRNFILFHMKRHPRDMGDREFDAYRTLVQAHIVPSKSFMRQVPASQLL